MKKRRTNMTPPPQVPMPPPVPSIQLIAHTEKMAMLVIAISRYARLKEFEKLEKTTGVSVLEADAYARLCDWWEGYPKDSKISLVEMVKRYSELTYSDVGVLKRIEDAPEDVQRAEV